MNIKNSLEIGMAALKELVAQTESKFFAVKHDHFSMQDARSAIRRLSEAIEYLEKQHPFGIYGAEDLDTAWKSGYDNCKEQRTWVGLTTDDWDEIRKQVKYNFEMTTGEYAERVSHLVEDKLREKNT